MDAARRLGVELTVGSERPNVLATKIPESFITIDLADLEETIQIVAEFNTRFPVRAVVGVDDQTTVVAAAIASSLSLPHNSLASVSAARNKHVMRELLSKSGVPQPVFSLHSVDQDPSDIASRVRYPCVVKPLTLAGSRGVIRANTEQEFVTAYRRLQAILALPDVASQCKDGSTRHVLIESFIPGKEVALEGLLSNGKLKVLAIFDKPDPLDGPFFEETIYVTPSHHPPTSQQEIAACAEKAGLALGLERGPVHAELRINDNGVCLIEIAARSIGGFCSRSLRFTASATDSKTFSLEELLLRDALDNDTRSFERETQSAGVMMIPIPRWGVLREVKRVHIAKSMNDIEDVVISAHLDEVVVPLPEGGKYLGFIFSRADSPDRAEAALREAHAQLEFVID